MVLAARLAEHRAVLDQKCEAIGRDPGEIATSTQALVFVLDDDAKAEELEGRWGSGPCVAGTPARIAERVAAWRDVGVDELIIPDFTLGTGSQRADALDTIIEQRRPGLPMTRFDSYPDPGCPGDQIPGKNA